MQFTSLLFIGFFAVVILLYFIVPKPLRPIALLISSAMFYASYSLFFTLLMFITILVTWICGIVLGRLRRKYPDSAQTKKRLVLAIGIVFSLSILFMYKYYNFTLDNVNLLLQKLHMHAIENRLNLALPMGISFYTFQALGYLIDVYRGTTRYEPDFIMFALFVSFFPQLVAGPIERSDRLLRQIRDCTETAVWDYERIVHGFMMMLWGYFMKMMIADRAALVVANRFANIYSDGTVGLTLGVVFFALQIYCDFASYSTIAAGSAKILGFDLMDNFNTPYFAVSIRDFWNRWHISLSTWFRDYLYIPLGGNRKGKIRKYINTMIVFLVSGLWHGANWTFVIWGGLHGAYQVIGDVTGPLKKRVYDKLRVDTGTFSFRAAQMLITFALTCIAWVFFRAESLNDACVYVFRLFTQPDFWKLTNGFIYEIGLGRQEMNILLLATAALIFIDVLRYRKKIRFEQIADRQNVWFRPAVILALIVVIVVFGSYGDKFNTQQFIYFEF